MCFSVLEVTRSTLYEQALALEANIASQSRQADGLWQNVDALDTILQYRTDRGEVRFFTVMFQA